MDNVIGLQKKKGPDAGEAPKLKGPVGKIPPPYMVNPLLYIGLSKSLKLDTYFQKNFFSWFYQFLKIFGLAQKKS
jgi:hypothetical protein